MNTRDAKTLANKLMTQHGLKQVGWIFQFDNAERRFGQCRYRSKTISLSEPLTLLNPKSQVQDTILHEIAHALAPGAHHGPRWKAKAREIGATPETYYGEAVNKPAPKYIGTCPNGHEHTLMRRSRAMERGTQACGVCCKELNFGRYSSQYVIVWRAA